MKVFILLPLLFYIASAKHVLPRRTKPVKLNKEVWKVKLSASWGKMTENCYIHRPVIEIAPTAAGEDIKIKSDIAAPGDSWLNGVFVYKLSPTESKFKADWLVCVWYSKAKVTLDYPNDNEVKKVDLEFDTSKKGCSYGFKLIACYDRAMEELFNKIYP